MRFIPLTRGQFAIVDDEDFESLSKFKWHYTCQGYAARREPMVNRKQGKFVFMHNQIIGNASGLEPDHKNLNRTDNRKENLRPATRQQNSWNKGPHKDNKLGVKGIVQHPENGRYRSSIFIDGKRKHLGYFDTIEEAKKAYDSEAKIYHGEFVHA